ncbi:FAD-dependent oxidoreductase, partial [bacterium]|nr:FAD-dependent oxidoreductase [bacterium]
MRQHYDIVVVGAGPAGSTAARFAASLGASVSLLERDREIGVPVRCAEGVSDSELRK